MKAITFIVRFITAQFREHLQKLVRRTYLIPPPSAVGGFLGAVLGLPLKELYEKSDQLMAGAELRSLKGRSVTIGRVFKMDRSATGLQKLVEDYYRLAELPKEKKLEIVKKMQELLTIKESEELYMPEYKFAVASSDEELIKEAALRLRNLDFEYDVFGGNDYNFVEYIGDVRMARLIRSARGGGYCRRADFKEIEAKAFTITWNIASATSQPLIIPATFLVSGGYEEFIQVYGAKIIARKEINAVNDGESTVFIYNVRPFLAVRI